MFDINNEELISRIIDLREESQYVIPLYVKIYNDIYALSELDEITDFTPSGFKVGFGSSNRIFRSNSFITQYLMDFDIIHVFNIGDDLNTKYNIFESRYVDEKSIMHSQINKYIEMLESYVTDRVIIYKKELLERFNQQQ